MQAKGVPTAEPVRRTQQQRRENTCRKLLEATIQCLVALGFSRCTTTEIVKAAGVSQGALFRYYPTKADLLAAAVEHLFEGLRRDFRRDLDDLGEQDNPAAAAFDLLWGVYTGPRLIAAFELYVAARTDPELAQALHPVVGRHRAELLEHAAELFPQVAQSPTFPAFVELLMCSMEGIAVERFGAGPDTGHGALEQLKNMCLIICAPGSER